MIEPLYKTAIFDLDGTLLDSLEDLYRAVNLALTKHAFPTRTRDEVRMFVGNGVENLIRRAIPEGTDEETFAVVLADYKVIYAAICMDHTAPYEGILDMLAALRAQGIRIAVASNKNDEVVRVLCRQCFGDLVECAAGTGEDVRKKPAPDTVLQVLSTMNCSTDRAVYIGDSDVDIQTARNLGIPCISVTWGFRDMDFLIDHGATALAHTPSELLGLLTAL